MDRPNDALVSPYGEDDQSGRLIEIDPRDWLVFRCAGLDGCSRMVELGIVPAIARFGPDTRIRSIARRMVCSVCRGRRILVHVAVDTRPTIERAAGPHPATLLDLG